MRSIKKQLYYTIMVLIPFILVITSYTLPVLAREELTGRNVWAWTKENLNPTWMEWGEKYWPTKPMRGGYYRTASAAYIGLMNPNHWPVNDWGSIGLFYEGITAYDGQYRQTVTWLMESFEFINPTTLIMKLKPGVTFHDGTDFNAKSLKYVFDWIGDKKNGCWTRGQQKRIKSLEVVDEYTLKWTTYKPWGSYPQGFFAFQISEKALRGDVAFREAKSAARILKTARKKWKKAEKKSKKLAATGGKAAQKAAAKLEKTRNALARAEKNAKMAAEKAKGHKSTDVYPVGTGRFMYEEARPGNYLKVKRNPNWWFGKSIGKPEMPYFDGVKVTVIPDPAIRLANLRAGKIDTMGFTKSQYHMVKNDPQITVHTHPNNSTSILIFNQATGPCKDIRVRKAISHAIDRKALISGTQFGLARLASCMYPDDHWAHNPTLIPVPHDPELSKKLLAEAGFQDGLTLRGLNYNYSEAKTLGEAIKEMLVQVGIEWKVDVLDSAAVSDRTKNLEYDLAVSALPYIQDPDAHASFIYHPDGGHHHGRNDNKELIALIEAGRYEIEEKKRQQIYYKIEESLYNNYMDVWLFWDITAIAFRKNVQGWNNEMFIENRTLYTSSHPMWFKDGHP
jgi:ABC-type transport system substrate-binding protein